METQLPFTILAQPTETTCGPTCLHAIYNYYDDPISLDTIIKEVSMLDEGGTLAVLLACHALKRGYKATIYTYNLHVFDPTWFKNFLSPSEMQNKLQQQNECKHDPKLQKAANGYIEFLSLNGTLKFQDLNSSLVRKYLNRGIPILTGLSSTYLHRSARESAMTNKPDDIRGVPEGHFVVLYGYNKEDKMAFIAEPQFPNPLSGSQYYKVKIDRLICSILLGIVTYDANFLIIEKTEGFHGKSNCCQ